jgi:hypothetical protein
LIQKRNEMYTGWKRGKEEVGKYERKETNRIIHH